MTVTAEKTEIKIADYADIVDVDKATWAYLNALEAEDLRTQLFPHVRNRMASIQRAIIRSHEDEVFAGDGAESVPAPVNLLERRGMLSGDWFPLEDGRRVFWLEATAAEHHERAEMQRRLAGTCLVDADRHELAAGLIEKYGATCLQDIEL